MNSRTVATTGILFVLSLAVGGFARAEDRTCNLQVPQTDWGKRISKEVDEGCSAHLIGFDDEEKNLKQWNKCCERAAKTLGKDGIPSGEDQELKVALGVAFEICEHDFSYNDTDYKRGQCLERFSFNMKDRAVEEVRRQCVCVGHQAYNGSISTQETFSYLLTGSLNSVSLGEATVWGMSRDAKCQHDRLKHLLKGKAEKRGDACAEERGSTANSDQQGKAASQQAATAAQNPETTAAK